MLKTVRVFLSLILFVSGGLLFSQASFAKPKQATTFEYSGPAISFDDIYQNPDDNELRMNFARQQASEGDFLSAAFALEGMLYANPNWDTARLFYAILLAELDDQGAAMYEFGILKDRPLNPEHRAIANAYLKKLEGA